MKRQPTQGDYQKKVKKIKKMVIDIINQHYSKSITTDAPPSMWTSAFLKVVWFGEGNKNGWKSKLRVSQTDGGTMGIQTDFELDNVVHEVGDIKDIIFCENKWYGFEITVHPNGKYEIELDRDPNCCNDSHWYES